MCSSCIFDCQVRVRRGGQEERERREEKVRKKEKERDMGVVIPRSSGISMYFSIVVSTMWAFRYGTRIYSSNRKYAQVCVNYK